jgi:hypothetical protein
MRMCPPRLDDAGVAAIEFAITAPMLLMIIAAIIEFGLAIRDTLSVQTAAAVGGQYTMQKGFDSPAISAAVLNATGAAGVRASPAPALFCGCPGATGIVNAVCNTICVDGIKARRYVVISASIDRTTVVNVGFGLPAVLTRTSIVRLP